MGYARYKVTVKFNTSYKDLFILQRTVYEVFFDSFFKGNEGYRLFEKSIGFDKSINCYEGFSTRLIARLAWKKIRKSLKESLGEEPNCNVEIARITLF